MDYLLHHLPKQSLLRCPEKEALVCGSVRVSYQEFSRQVLGVAQGLRNAGLARGERVAIYLDAGIPEAVSIFGISQAGGVVVPINPQLISGQVLHICADCQTTALITSAARLNQLVEALPSIGSLRFLVIVEDEQPIPSLPLPAYMLKTLLGTEPETPWREWCISKDLAAIIYTSGSTGKSKGVMLSHANVIAGASIVSTYLEITENDRILAVLPFSFDAGLNQLTTALQQGATCVLTRFALARDIVTLLVKEQITGLAGVPTLWSLLTQRNSGLGTSEVRLRYVTNTGGAMPQSVLSRLRQDLPKTRIYLMYGLTEAFRSTYLPPEELDRRPTSMGKAIPDTEILVVGPDGNLCTAGQVGELVHRGATVAMGYWNNPTATAAVFRANPVAPAELGTFEKGCYFGDLVKTDEEGFLYHLGRRDTMIKSSGYRISPSEIEEVLFQSGMVGHAAVIGIPDLILGQSIKAFVTCRDGEQISAQRLLAYCSENLPRYMLPKSVQVLQELPKTSSGKVDYPTLHTLAANQVFSQASDRS